MKLVYGEEVSGMDIRLNRNKGDLVFDIINNSLLVCVLFIVFYPLLYVVSASFSDPMAVMQGKVWFLPIVANLDSYKRVFMNSDILVGYRNTILYTVVGTLINVVMTIAGAYPLSRKKFYARNVILAFFTFTMFFSGGIIPNYLIIKKLGLINNFWVMILPATVQVWNLIIMKTFFQNSIPEELHEAAYVDGGTNMGILFKIVLPLSTPIIAVMVLFYGIGHWNAFFNALIYLSDRSKFPLQLIIREILIESQMESMMSSSSDSIADQKMYAESIKYAVIIVASLPALMIYPVIQKYFVKGVMVGAIKG